jgi:hypothetical protein
MNHRILEKVTHFPSRVLLLSLLSFNGRDSITCGDEGWSEGWISSALIAGIMSVIIYGRQIDLLWIRSLFLALP